MLRAIESARNYLSRAASFRREPLAVAMLVVSVLAHLVSYAFTRRLGASERFPFMQEAELLILLSLAGSFAGFLITSRPYFHGVLYARFFVDLVVMRIVGPGGIAVKLLLLDAFLIDAALYEPVRPGIITGAMATVAVVVNELVFTRLPDAAAYRLHATTLALSGIVVGGGYLIISYLREKAVADERTIGDLNKAFDKLTRSNLGLQSYAANVGTESAKEERERITRELHDSIGYALTNIAMLMNASKVLIKESNRDRLSALIEHTRETAHKCLQETRSTLYRLRSINEQSPAGLNMLVHLGRVYSDATGTQVSVEYGNASRSYGGLIDTTVYRFVQEGLTNAFRHNRAARITIRVSLYEEEGTLHVRVWDNGKGAQEITEGLGLTGMRERLQVVGGSMYYGSVVDGFVVRAGIPLEGEEGG